MKSQVTAKDSVESEKLAGRENYFDYRREIDELTGFEVLESFEKFSQRDYALRNAAWHEPFEFESEQQATDDIRKVAAFAGPGLFCDGSSLPDGAVHRKIRTPCRK